MKITLIEPAMIKRDGFSEKPMFTLQPLTLGVLAGLTPPGYDVRMVDDRIETIDYDESTDLVGISVQTFMARRAYEIAAEYRRRGVPVVLGGYHPTLLPEEARQHADAIVIGEAEGVWPALLEDACRGRLQPVYCVPQHGPLQGMRVDRSVYKQKHYLSITPVETVRGCLNDCAFCAAHARSWRSS